MNGDVKWPGQRGDVLAALELLSGAPPELTQHGADPRWPDLRNAVHWLVDDTWWDLKDPAESIGTILRSDTEAAALRPVVAALVDVVDRHAPRASDASWFGDASWPTVRALANDALNTLRDGDQNQAAEESTRSQHGG